MVKRTRGNCVFGNAPEDLAARKRTFVRIFPTDHSDGFGNFRFVNMQETCAENAAISALDFFLVKNTEFC